jgi:hypothetical protein
MEFYVTTAGQDGANVVGLEGADTAATREISYGCGNSLPVVKRC